MYRFKKYFLLPEIYKIASVMYGNGSVNDLEVVRTSWYQLAGFSGECK